MRHQYLTRALLALLPVWAGACSGSATDPFSDTSNGSGSLARGSAGDGAGSEASSSLVGHFPGAGTSGSGDALTAGMAPETAGACTSDVLPLPVAQPAPVETICLYSEDGDDVPEAIIEQVVEVIDEREWVHVRLTLNPSFVDNSYGDAAIGWQGREKPSIGPAAAPDAVPPQTSPEPPPPDVEKRGAEPRGGGAGEPPEDPRAPMTGAGGKAAHTFRDLLGSDHAEIQLRDDDGDVSLHFKLDYISQSASAPSGYASLGVSGGEGKLLEGDPSWILAATTSLDRNLNGCGLSQYSESSPETDADYTPNPEASEWDYRVVYEVWVAPEAFGASGFGTASVEFVHASPSKFASNTATVTPRPCPPGDDDPPLDDDGIVVFPEEDPPTIR